MSWLDSDLLLNWRNAWNIFGMKIECFIKPFPVFKFQLHLGFASKPREQVDREIQPQQELWVEVGTSSSLLHGNLQNVLQTCVNSMMMFAFLFA